MNVRWAKNRQTQVERKMMARRAERDFKSIVFASNKCMLY